MRNSTKAKSTPGADKVTVKVDKHCTQPEAYARGVAFNKRQRRENKRLDAAAEAWKQEELIINTANVLVEINGETVIVERSLAYQLLGSQEARYIGAE